MADSPGPLPPQTCVSGIERQTVQDGKKHKVKTVYVLEVETDAGLIRRKYRYSDFHVLFHILKSKTPPIAGFPKFFPPKRLIHSAKTLEKRRIGFQRFLAQLLRIPGILAHKELREFLGLGPQQHQDQQQQQQQQQQDQQQQDQKQDQQGAKSRSPAPFLATPQQQKFRAARPAVPERATPTSSAPSSPPDGFIDADDDDAESPQVPARPESDDLAAGAGAPSSRPRGWSELDAAMLEFEEGVAAAESKRASFAPAPPPLSARASRIVNNAGFISDLDAQLGTAPSSSTHRGVDSDILAALLDGDDDSFLDMTDPSFADFYSDMDDDDELDYILGNQQLSSAGVDGGADEADEAGVSEFGWSEITTTSDDQGLTADELTSASDDEPGPPSVLTPEEYEAFLHTVPLPPDAETGGVLKLVRAFAAVAQWPNANHACAEEYAKLSPGLTSLGQLKAALQDPDTRLPLVLEPHLATFLEDVAFRTPADVEAWNEHHAPKRERRASSILQASIVASLHRYLGAFESASGAAASILAVPPPQRSLPSLRDLLAVLVSSLNGVCACLTDLEVPGLPPADAVKRSAAAVLIAAKPVFDDDTPSDAAWPTFDAAFADLTAFVADLTRLAETHAPPAASDPDDTPASRITRVRLSAATP